MDYLIYQLIFIFIVFLLLLQLCIGTNIIRFITIWIFILLILLYKLKKREPYTNMNPIETYPTMYKSCNQQLIDGVNPKTKLNPIIKPPIYMNTPPIQMNTYTLENKSRSGYSFEYPIQSTPISDLYPIELLYRNEYTDVPIQSNYGITRTYHIAEKKYNQSFNNESNYVSNRIPSDDNNEYYLLNQNEVMNDNYNENTLYLNDIYDPRYYGYGNVSTYTYEPTSSTHTYDYSEIENIRKPKFICKSKIDHNEYNPKRPFHDVTMDFIDNTNFFRYNLQESLMRKKNAVMEERKKHPIRGDLQFKYNHKV